MSEPILSIQNLQVNYGGIEAVKGISFDVPEGEIVTLIGANGAGKSSTLRAISGLVKPKSGKILFKGEDITGKNPTEIVSKGITLVPEGRRIFADLTVKENLRVGPTSGRTTSARTWSGSLTSSPGFGRESGRPAAPYPAVSSRCLPWAVP